MVNLSWEYLESDGQLTLMVLNTGRADVTIARIDLYIIHEEITRRSRNGKYFNAQEETVDHISSEHWLSDDSVLPARLAANSIISMPVKNDEIHLPSEFPLDEFLLKFVARHPGGRSVVYLRGDVLRHFLGIDTDRPISMPSAGSLPAEE